jgi:DNA-binding response OmpR family regulator
MKVLIAEDDPTSRCFLEATLVKWGFEVTVARDGAEAIAAVESGEMPAMAILDWMMPGIDGVEVCRRLRARGDRSPVYTIILTARSEKQDVIAGLEAGADDYVTKPFDRQEMHARLKVGMRIVELQRSLAARIKELEMALSQVKRLRSLLPICSYCKKVRDDKNYWQQVECYASEHLEVEFSHSICPPCYEKFVEPQVERLKKRD